MIICLLFGTHVALKVFNQTVNGNFILSIHIIDWLTLTGTFEENKLFISNHSIIVTGDFGNRKAFIEFYQILYCQQNELVFIINYLDLCKVMVKTNLICIFLHTLHFQIQVLALGFLQLLFTLYFDHSYQRSQKTMNTVRTLCFQQLHHVHIFKCNQFSSDGGETPM